MATVSPDVMIQPTGREPLRVVDQVSMFHLLLVVLDPYTYESSWVLETAGRILEDFREADCRAAFLVTADAKDAATFLGPWADRQMVFIDPDRTTVKGLGLEKIPALIHIGNDASVIGKSESWDPDGWREITDNLSSMMSWSRPVFPIAGDPVAFEGSPALG